MAPKLEIETMPVVSDYATDHSTMATPLPY